MVGLMSKEEYANLWAEVRENRLKLKACPAHRFGAGTYVFGKKMTCLECGGTMRGDEMSSYLEGFKAAGGNPVDVWPDYK